MNPNHRLLAGASLSAALCLAAHWFPLTQPRKPRGPVAYLLACGYGCLAILAGTGLATDRHTLRRVTAVTTAAGAATVAAHLVDTILHGYALRRAYERHS